MSLRKTKLSRQDFFGLLILVIALGENYIVEVMFNKAISLLKLNSLLTGRTAMYIVFLGLFLCEFINILNRLIQKKAYDVFFVVAVFLGTVFFIGLGNSDTFILYKDSLIRILVLYVPIYLFSRSIDNYSRILRYLWIVAYIFIAFLLYAQSVSKPIIQQGYDTNMATGYQYTMCAFILFDSFTNNENNKLLRIINLLAAIFCFVYVIGNGSRGATIACVVYFLVVFYRHLVSTKFGFKHIFLIALFITFTLFLPHILSTFRSFFLEIGINSRTLSWMIGMDTDLDSSGRDVLYTLAINKIIENPLGYGLFGDNILLGYYVHNLFLELLLNFGIIFGGLIVIFIIYGFIKSVINTKTVRIANIIVVYSIMQLQFSNSYLYLGAFWFALGIIFNAIAIKQSERKLK